MKFLITGLMLGTLLVGCKESSKTTAAAKVSEFKQYEVSGLTLDLPSEPRSTPMELPADVRKMIASLETHEINRKSTKILVSHMVAKVPEANLEGAADGAIGNVKAQPGVTGFTSSKENVVVDGLQGRTMKMTFKNKGFSITQHGLVFVRGSELWQIQIIGVAGGGENPKELEELKDTIFSSVQLL